MKATEKYPQNPAKRLHFYTIGRNDYWKIRSKGTATFCVLKEDGNLLGRDDKRAERTLLILFPIENSSGALSGNCPIVMADKYKGFSICDCNAPVQECTGKRIIPVDPVREDTL